MVKRMLADLLEKVQQKFQNPIAKEVFLLTLNTLEVLLVIVNLELQEQKISPQQQFLLLRVR